MILATHGFLASSIGQIDADAQAFFDRVTTAGGTLSNTEKSAVNQLVLDMKAAGIWTKMKAVYPMVGASAAACAQNLKSSSFTGTFTATGWTFASTGATPNGTSAFMDTNLNSNTSLNLNDSHASVYLRTNSDGLYCDLGNFNTTTGINIFARLVNAQYIRINDEDVNTVATTDSRGFRFGSRITSTTKNIYINNSRTDFAQNSLGKADLNIYIGARNFVGNADFFSNRENAFTSIGDGLTNAQGSDFYTAVQAFQTTLRREV
jgi:hypothetical protein